MLSSDVWVYTYTTHMATKGATRAKGTRPLDLEKIVEIAAELIEDEGFEALTMRALAERCGVTAMSLYRHVRTKEDLLLILAGSALEDLKLPKEGSLPWGEEITQIFRSLHRLLLEHPEFAQLTASQPIDALVAQRGMEMVLATLQREGLDDEEAVTAYDALVSYARGFNQRHTGGPPGASTISHRLSAIRELRREEFPHLVKLAGPLVARDPDKHFDDGLALVIAGIERQIAGKRKRKRR